MISKVNPALCDDRITQQMEKLMNLIETGRKLR